MTRMNEMYNITRHHRDEAYHRPPQHITRSRSRNCPAHSAQQEEAFNAMEAAKENINISRTFFLLQLDEKKEVIINFIQWTKSGEEAARHTSKRAAASLNRRWKWNITLMCLRNEKRKSEEANWNIIHEFRAAGDSMRRKLCLQLNTSPPSCKPTSRSLSVEDKRCL